MNAWVKAAGKLARYEHIGWKAWPHSRCWSFHSGASAIGGSSSGSSRASWPGGDPPQEVPTWAVQVLLTTHRSRSVRWVAECSTRKCVLEPPVSFVREQRRAHRHRCRLARDPGGRRQSRHPPDRSRMGARHRGRLGIPDRPPRGGLRCGRGHRGWDPRRGPDGAAHTRRSIRRRPGRSFSRRSSARCGQPRSCGRGGIHGRRSRHGRPCGVGVRAGRDRCCRGRARASDPDGPDAGPRPHAIRAGRGQREQQHRRGCRRFRGPPRRGGDRRQRRPGRGMRGSGACLRGCGGDPGRPPVPR